MSATTEETRTSESFCACGRRTSECDGSRKGCARATPEAPTVLYRRVDTGIGIGHEPVGGVIPAMRMAADALHKIASASAARRRLAEDRPLTWAMRKNLESKRLEDEEVETFALDAFEALVLALRAAGASDVTVHECGEGDITP